MASSDGKTSPDVVWHHATVTRERRESLQGHKAAALWFTGLPSSGKSTIAHSVEERLHQLRCRTFVLDGDNVRHGLCGDLGFSEADREENIRRIGEMAKLFLESGTIVLAAFVSPTRRDRERARGLLQHGDFLEIFCRCPVSICEHRDPKGHYQRAKAGQLKNFTGVSAPYEEPVGPELVLDTDQLTIEDSVSAVLRLLRDRGVVSG
jgi:adenylylsulfate kinase